MTDSHPHDLLSPYLDDELPVEERSRVDRHLATCEDCRTELASLRTMAAAMAGDAVPPPPVDLLAKIGRRLDDARPQPRISRWAIPATIAATLGAVGILVTLQLREGRFAPPPSRPVFHSEEPKSGPQPLDTPAPAAPTYAPAPPKARQDAGALSKLQKDDDAARRNVADKSKKASDAIEPLSSAGPRERDSKKEVLPEAPSGSSSELSGPGDLSLRGMAGGVSSAAPSAPSAQGEEVGRVPELTLGPGVTNQAAAKQSTASVCEYPWSFSGVRGTWAVDDVATAARALDRLARDVGGIGQWTGPADGRPYVIVMPRAHFDEVLSDLRARNVAGLPGSLVLPQGSDCVSISIAITGAPAPR